jgi:hypothetical protein
MDYIDNRGEKIGSLTVSISADKMIVINRVRKLTTVSVRDRHTGQVSTETSSGTPHSASWPGPKRFTPSAG